jgi:hypothetical protein
VGGIWSVHGENEEPDLARSLKKLDEFGAQDVRHVFKLADFSSFL